MTRSLATLALAASLALAGCSQDEAVEPPTIGSDEPSDSTPSTEPSPSPSEPSEPEEAFDGEGHLAMRGDIRATGGQEQAVVDAWIAYWQVRMDAFAVPEVDPAALGEVAQGDAASQVVGYVSYLEENKLRTEGDLRFDISRVSVKGPRAVVQACVTNQSVDVRRNGSPAEPLTPFYEFQGRLSRVSDTWIVSRVIDTGSGPC